METGKIQRLGAALHCEAVQIALEWKEKVERNRWPQRPTWTTSSDDDNVHTDLHGLPDAVVSIVVDETSVGE